MKLPKIWELLKNFMRRCEDRGWKTSPNEDLVSDGERYHSFLWAHNVHPSTFRKLSAHPKSAFREGRSYRVVNASYIAWVFPQPPPESFLEAVLEDEELLRRTAIFDVSQFKKRIPVCLALNETDSRVFKEFESFLKEKWGVTVRRDQDFQEEVHVSS